jgi:hypothetical protein
VVAKSDRFGGEFRATNDGICLYAERRCLQRRFAGPVSGPLNFVSRSGSQERGLRPSDVYWRDHSTGRSHNRA